MEAKPPEEGTLESYILPSFLRRAIAEPLASLSFLSITVCTVLTTVERFLGRVAIYLLVEGGRGRYRLRPPQRARISYWVLPMSRRISLWTDTFILK